MAAEPGRCAFCGCTEQARCNAMAFSHHAAPGVLDWFGVNPIPVAQLCVWANDDHTCCSVCDAVLKRLAELPPDGYVMVLELTEKTRKALDAVRAKRAER